MLTVCFHGAESTGKSVLAEQLRREHGWPWVPEYGRAYAEAHGTAFTMADLLAIARGQDAAMRAAVAAGTSGAAGAGEPVLVLDTDPLMTAAWAQMLFGTVPDELLGYPKADLYLLFDADTPWRDDGTRLFGSAAARARFAALAEALLVRAGVRWERVGGDWATRAAPVRDAIARAQGAGGP